MFARAPTFRNVESVAGNGIDGSGKLAGENQSAEFRDQLLTLYFHLRSFQRTAEPMTSDT
jgi:hypothetical protein